MDGIISIYTAAWRGLLGDRRTYFTEDFELIDSKSAYLAAIGGFIALVLVQTLLSGGVVAAIGASIVGPLVLAVMLAMLSIYTLLFSNIFFDKGVTLPQVWFAYVKLMAITMPIHIVQALLGLVLPAAIMGLLGIVFLILMVMVGFWFFRYAFDYSVKQYIIFNIPPFAFGILMGLLAATSLQNIDKIPANSDLQAEIEKLEQLEKQLAAKSQRVERRTNEVSKQARQLEQDVTKMSVQGLIPNEGYRYVFKGKYGRKPVQGSVVVRVKQYKGNRLLVTLDSKIDRAKGKEKFLLKAGANSVDLYQTLRKQLVKKSKVPHPYYKDVLNTLFAYQTELGAGMIAAQSGVKLAGLGMGKSLQAAKPKLTGRVKVAQRSGRRFEWQAGKSRTTFVHDAGLSLNLLDLNVKQRKKQLRFQLQKYVGGR